MPTLAFRPHGLRGILSLAALFAYPAVTPAQAPDSVTPIEASVDAQAQNALENYYRSSSAEREALVEESTSAPAGSAMDASGLPLPQSWTNSFFDPQPRFEFRAEAIWLQSNFDDSYPLARQSVPKDTDYELVDVGVRGNTDNTVAPRIAFEYHWNEQGSVEVAGFIMDGPRQSGYGLSEFDQIYYFDRNAASFPEQGGLFNTPTGFPLVATDATLDWQFSAYGGETNLLHHFVLMKGYISDLALGIGGRYLGVSEKVGLNISNELEGTSANMSVRTKNHIAGPQVVGRARINGPFKRVRWTAEGKIGLMANATNHENSIVTGQSALQTFDDNEIFFSPLFEGLFGCEIYLVRNVVVFGGYQLLYADRVDRAAGRFQADLNAFVQPSKHLDDIFLYGPRLGLLWSY
jgi:hypothetical protein